MSEESTSTKRLLLIDDDKKLCRLITDYLKPLGYEVHSEHSGPDGLRCALEEEFEAVILDVMLPGMDGFDVLKKLREESEVPVLMLTSAGEEVDRVVGLEMGADDYLPKTFSTRELLARLRAVTRRSQITGRTPTQPLPKFSEWSAGPLHLDEARHTVSLGDEPLELTPVEFSLLAVLLKAKGRVKSREQLIDEVADRSFNGFDRSVDVHISALRKKLHDDPKSPRFIRTIRAVGYMLVEPDRDTLEAGDAS